MPSATLTDVVFTQDIEAIECCACATPIWMSKQFIRNRRDDHQGFYCPNGHCQSFHGKSEEEKLREQLKAEREAKAALQRETAILAQDLTVEREARKSVQRKLSTTKATLTKTRKRVAGGVCPCCTRSFTNLRRHMATKHPDFAQQEVAETVEL